MYIFSVYLSQTFRRSIFLRRFHLLPTQFCEDHSSVVGNSESISTMKILNVAEKNDAAKNIAFHLSAGSSRRVRILFFYPSMFVKQLAILKCLL